MFKLWCEWGMTDCQFIFTDDKNSKMRLTSLVFSCDYFLPFSSLGVHCKNKIKFVCLPP